MKHMSADFKKVCKTALIFTSNQKNARYPDDLLASCRFSVREVS